MKGSVVEERFEYKCFPCVVVMQNMCFRTAYVGIPQGNPLYRKHYENINVDCHGGLTYARDSLLDQPETDLWWIGFDTAQWGDGYDYEAGKKLFADSEDNMEGILCMERIYRECGTNDFPFKSLEFCKSQCKSIVDQILESED